MTEDEACRAIDSCLIYDQRFGTSPWGNPQHCWIGFGSDGQALEVIAEELEDGSFYIFHAMKLTKATWATVERHRKER